MDYTGILRLVEGGEDRAFRNARQNSDPENARIESDQALGRVINDGDVRRHGTLLPVRRRRELPQMGVGHRVRTGLPPSRRSGYRIALLRKDFRGGNGGLGYPGGALSSKCVQLGICVYTFNWMKIWSQIWTGEQDGADGVPLLQL